MAVDPLRSKRVGFADMAVPSGEAGDGRWSRDRLRLARGWRLQDGFASARPWHNAWRAWAFVAGKFAEGTAPVTTALVGRKIPPTAPPGRHGSRRRPKGCAAL